MQPDPELERQWRERVSRLFEPAPAADADRLETVLAAVRTRRVRARQRRRIAWTAAAASLLGMAAASGAWWLSREPAPPTAEQHSESAGEPAERHAGDQPPTDSDERRQPTRDDGPVIYRQAK